MSFRTRYPGTVCDVCGQLIAVGALARNQRDGYVHVTCPEVAELAPPPRTALCPECFTYHAGGCA